MFRMDNFESSINNSDLTDYVSAQFNNFFPSKQKVKPEEISSSVVRAIERIQFNFQHINLPYYYREDKVVFNHFHGDHYCIFLCYLSEALFKAKKIEIASKAFSLNKLLHGIDAFYEIEFPDIFLVVHPIGTILGRAKYSNYMVFYQNVTIGTDLSGIYPTFKGKHILYSKSSIIGDCIISEGVNFGAGSFIMNTNIKSNKNIVGSYPSHRVLEDKKNIISNLFNI